MMSKLSNSTTLNYFNSNSVQFLLTKKIKAIRLLIMVLLASNLSLSYAQITISGGSSVNGSYGTLSSAITALNGATISGPVVVDVNAGASFVEDLPEITFTGSITNTITIQKSGVGANPVITPNLGGTIASSTTIGGNGDGIIVINGGDFITFDGIDVQTNPALTVNARIEYGYYLKKASATDACKNVIIRNANITLDKTTIFSFGIFVSNISGTATVTVTSVGGRSEDISIYNNNISNSYGGIQLRGYAASSPYDLYDQNIFVGTDGTNSITNYGGGATAVYGIYTINQNNCNISNNNIIGGDGSTSTHYGIFITTSNNGNHVVENNFIDMTNSSTTSQTTAIYSNIGTTGNTNNSVNIINNILTINRPSATTGVTYFIYSTSNYPFNFNITGNTIENSTLAGTGAIYGFYNISNPTNLNINNNIIRNITRTSSTSTSLFYGISNGSGTVANSTINNNTIYDLIGNGSTGAVGGIVVGTTTNVSNINNNKIYNISNTNAGGVVYGITQNSASLVSNIYNNYISELNTSLTSSTTDAIRGINLTGTTANSTSNISFNTVYLNASSSGTNFSTSALYHTYSATSTTNSLVLKNNILVNLSTAMGTGITSAFRRSASTDLNNFATMSNNNLFYAGASSATNLIYYDGTNSDQTLAAFKARVSPREAVSVTEFPNFISTTPTDPTYLHINTSIATQIEGGGVNIPAITLDYDGNTRNIIPDIGADEFVGVPIDLNPPIITYTPLISSCDGSSRTLVVTISDASGIPTSGAGLPVLYWKINAGAWIPSTGSNTNPNEYTFTLGAGAALNDSISYYIAAQDLAMTPNVGIFPQAGASGFSSNPPAASTPPTVVSFYKVIPTLNGNYNVGSGGDFTTLTAAVAAYNARCLIGPVIFNLTDATYSSSETFPIVINANNYSSSTNTLTIKPSSGNNVVVSGTVAAGSIIKLNGADYITIDGSNNGSDSRNLTVQNLTTTTSGNAVVWLSAPAAANGSNNNTVKNCIIEGNSSTTSFFGVYVGGNATISLTAAGLERCNNNSFDNNLFRKSLFGFVAFGFAANSPDLNNLITNNNFGTAIAGEGFQNEGIHIDRQDGLIISGNEIQNIVSSTTTSQYGMRLLDFKNGQCINNNVHDILNTSTSTTPRLYGILVLSSTYSTVGNPSNATIANNFVSKLNTAATSTTWNSSGICASTGFGDKYYYNTVHLTGQLNNSPSGLSAAFAHGDGTNTTPCNNVDVRNNIFNVEGSSAGGNIYAVYSKATSFVGSISNHNLLRCAGTGATNNTAFAVSNYPTLASWQAATNLDLNSIENQPIFVSNTDLHIAANAANVVLNNLGSPVSVTVDYDLNTRDVSTPDIGAHEFDFVQCAGTPNAGIINPASGSKCSGENYTISPTNLTAALGISYQWQVSTTSGSGFMNVINGSGGTTSSYTTGALMTGTYYYRLETTCANGGLTNVSNEFTLTVNQTPTASITPPGTTSICAPNSQIFNSVSDIGNTYVWKKNSIIISGATLPTYSTNTSGAYKVIISVASTGCKDSSGVSNLTVNPQPLNPMVNATPNPSCLGDNVNLSSSASIPGYSINTSGTATFIDVDATGASVGTVSDDSEHNITMPSFTFNGVSYTTARVGMNGVIVLGSTTGDVSTANAALPSTANTAGNVFLAPYWDDLDIQPGATIKTETVGSKFIIQYSNASHNLFTTGIIKFQVQMDNSNNQIHFVYDDVVFGDVVYDNGIAATVGIQFSSSLATQHSFNTTSLSNGQCITFAPNNLAYNWTGPNSFSSNLQNPTITSISAAEVGMYQVVFSNQITSCTDTLAITLINATGPSIINEPASFNSCLGGNGLFTVSAFGASLTYLWEESIDGGNIWNPVSNGGIYSGATSATLSLTGLSNTQNGYKYRCVVTSTCGSPVTTNGNATLTVNPLPSALINPSTSTVCFPGGPPATLTASGGVSYIWTPILGLSAGTGAVVNALPSDTITYTVLVTDINGCTNTASAVVNVNLGPSLSTSATFNSICEGNSTTITANSGGIQQLTIGTSTTTIGGNDGNPYRSGNGNGNQIRSQLLYSAAELTNAGFSAGSITGLGFTTTGAVGIVANFSIAIGQTNVSTLNANFETSSLTQVFTQASFTPQVGLNMHVFNVNSFSWDGTSNLLLDICQTNTATQGTTTVSAYTPGFNSNTHKATTTTSCSSLTGVIVANKPIVTLLGTSNNNGMFTFSWQPGNISGNQIIVSPTSTTTYIVTASGSNGCEDSEDETIVVNGTVVNSQLNAGGGSLRDVYACINEGGTITYNTGMNIDSSFLTAPLVISKNVTIQGNGNVLIDFQGSMANGLLINAAKSLTLENMNVNGGNGVTSTVVNNGLLNLKSSTINGSNLPVVQNNNGASVEVIENSGQSNIKQN